MVMLLHDRFESSTMRAHRKRLATLLLSRGELKQADDQVLIFFETIGLLVHKRVLYSDMVWNEFCWEVVRYWEALTTPVNQISRLREAAKDKTLYCEFEEMNERLLRIDCKRRGVGLDVARPNRTEINEFLNDEGKLDV